MGYRETFFKYNKGTKLPFRRGTYYRCVSCGGWYCKSQITVDHRIPKRCGGTDDLWNLQPMCKSCNSSKGARHTGFDTASTMLRATANGQLGKAVGGMAKRKVKDAFGIKYKRR
jgi:5-methylcytosine-specific restriction endonuclease McrA